MEEERDECLEATRNLLQNYPTIEGEYILNIDDCLYEEQVVTSIPTNNNNNNNTDGDLAPVVLTQNIQTQSNDNNNNNNDDYDDDGTTDLTSLNWLHNITNIMAVPNLPTPPVSPKPPKKKVQNNNNNNGSQQEDLTININYYKRNGDKKPPFSYATLICMAMGRNGNKMTLSAIYHWIRENFLYYRRAHPSWQVCYIKKKKKLKLN